MKTTFLCLLASLLFFSSHLASASTYAVGHKFLLPPDIDYSKAYGIYVQEFIFSPEGSKVESSFFGFHVIYGADNYIEIGHVFEKHADHTQADLEDYIKFLDGARYLGMTIPVKKAQSLIATNMLIGDMRQADGKSQQLFTLQFASHHTNLSPLKKQYSMYQRDYFMHPKPSVFTKVFHEFTDDRVVSYIQDALGTVNSMVNVTFLNVPYADGSGMARTILTVLFRDCQNSTTGYCDGDLKKDAMPDISISQNLLDSIYENNLLKGTL